MRRRLTLLFEDDREERRRERAHATENSKESAESYAATLRRAGKHGKAERVEMGWHARRLKGSYDRYIDSSRKDARMSRRIKTHLTKIGKSGVWRYHPQARFADEDRADDNAKEMREAAEKYGGHGAVSRAIRPSMFDDTTVHVNVLGFAHGHKEHDVPHHRRRREAERRHWSAVARNYENGDSVVHIDLSGQHEEEHQRRAAHFMHGLAHYYSKASITYEQNRSGMSRHHAVGVFTRPKPSYLGPDDPWPIREWPPGHEPVNQ